MTWMSSIVSACLVATPLLTAQSEPFKVYDTRPVILHGPYLVAPTETSAVIAWSTDTPCHSKVVYGIGTLGEEAANSKDGLLPVGTVHSVRISGLRPGQTYQYKVVSTRVVKMKAYWPDKGLAAESPVYSFTTLDAGKSSAAFSVITDTHEDVPRIIALMKLIDWTTTDFLVHTGDAFHGIETEDQLYAKWLDPISKGLAQSKGLMFARGNHDTRGAFARELAAYVPIEEGRFYYARDHGPVHLLAIDTGEDKPDSTNVYSRLNDFAAYRRQELHWLREHTRESRRMSEAPFRVVVMHQPNWGWVDGANDEWSAWANEAKIDLVVAGHRHRFLRTKPGERGNNFPVVVVGQDQVGRVEASGAQMKVSVTGKDGVVVDSFLIERR